MKTSRIFIIVAVLVMSVSQVFAAPFTGFRGGDWYIGAGGNIGLAGTGGSTFGQSGISASTGFEGELACAFSDRLALRVGTDTSVLQQNGKTVGPIVLSNLTMTGNNNYIDLVYKINEHVNVFAGLDNSNEFYVLTGASVASGPLGLGFEMGVNAGVEGTYPLAEGVKLYAQADVSTTRYFNGECGVVFDLAKCLQFNLGYEYSNYFRSITAISGNNSSEINFAFQGVAAGLALRL